MSYEYVVGIFQDETGKAVAFAVVVASCLLSWFIILPFLKGKDSWSEVFDALGTKYKNLKYEIELKKIIKLELSTSPVFLLNPGFNNAKLGFNVVKWWRRRKESKKMKKELVRIYIEQHREKNKFEKQKNI